MSSPRRWARWALCVLGLVGVIVVLFAGGPERAEAAPRCPGWAQWTSPGTCAALEWVDDEQARQVDSVVRDTINVVLFSLTGANSQLLTAEWLTTVPNYAADPGGQSPGVGAAGGENLDKLHGLSTAIGMAVLGLVVTLAVIGNWAAGFAGAKGDIMGGVIRAAGAGLFILAWPWIFEQGVVLSNVMSELLLNRAFGDAAGWLDDAASLEALEDATVALVLLILLGLPLIVVMFALVMIKIALNAGTAFLFVAMPISVALWPVPGFSWLAQWAVRVGIALLLIPVGWALMVALAAALSTDFMAGPLPEGNVIAQYSVPLVALGVALLMAKWPGMLLRTAGLVSGGSGFMSSFLAFTGSHLAFRAIARNLPDALGGSRETLRERAGDRAHQFQREGITDQRNAQRDQASAARDTQGQARHDWQQAKNQMKHTQDPVLSTDRTGNPVASQQHKNVSQAERAGFMERAARGEASAARGIEAYNGLPLGTQQAIHGAFSSGSQGQVSNVIGHYSGAGHLDPGVRENLRVLGGSVHQEFDAVRDQVVADGPPEVRATETNAAGEPTQINNYEPRPIPPAPNPADLVGPAGASPGGSPSVTNRSAGSGT